MCSNTGGVVPTPAVAPDVKDVGAFTKQRRLWEIILYIYLHIVHKDVGVIHCNSACKRLKKNCMFVTIGTGSMNYDTSMQ